MVSARYSDFAICSCGGIVQICQWYRVCDAGALRAEPLATLYILRGQNSSFFQRRPPTPTTTSLPPSLPQISSFSSSPQSSTPPRLGTRMRQRLNRTSGSFSHQSEITREQRSLPLASPPSPSERQRTGEPEGQDRRAPGEAWSRLSEERRDELTRPLRSGVGAYELIGRG